MIETYTTMNLKFMNPYIFTIWHGRLSHLMSIMMKKLIENSYAHLLKSQKMLQYNELPCDVCFSRKIIN